MDKRGDVPTVLLFIGTLLIYIAAFYFLLTSSAGNVSTDDLSYLGKEADLLESYLQNELYFIVSNSSECLKQYHSKLCVQNVVKDYPLVFEKSDFFGKLRNGDFELDDSKSEIEVFNVHIRISYGNSKLERVINLISEA